MLRVMKTLSMTFAKGVRTTQNIFEQGILRDPLRGSTRRTFSSKGFFAPAQRGVQNDGW